MSNNGAAFLSLFLIGATAPQDDLHCPTDRSEASYVMNSPRIVVGVQPLSTLLTKDAVLAVEVLVTGPALEKTDRAIEVFEPLRANFAAGSLIGRQLIEGRLRPCIYWGLEGFEPPVDDEGRPFPDICLEEQNDDGGFEKALFFAYGAKPDKGILEADIEPVHLNPVAVNVEEPWTRFYRRLRVISINDNHMSFVTEFAMGPGVGEAEPIYWSTAEENLTLSEGQMEIGDLKFDVIRLGPSWTVTPRGSFPDWVELSCQGTQPKITNRSQATAPSSSNIRVMDIPMEQ